MARSASPALGKGVVCLSALSAVHAGRDVKVPPANRWESHCCMFLIDFHPAVVR